MNENDFEKELDAQTEKRIAEMEKADYVFPQRFGTKDYIIAAIVAVICLAGVIAGGFIG